MPISSEHPEYTEYKHQWQVTRDALRGGERVHKYIILPYCGRVLSKAMQERNDNFKRRAVYDNFVLPTKQGLLGLAMRKPESLILPPQLEYLRDEATTSRLSFKQAIKLTLGEQIQVGRVIVVSDYAAVAPNMTAEQKRMNNIHARLAFYKTEDVINWEVNTKYNQTNLKKIVIRCFVETRPDGYKTEYETQYIELFLEDNGAYAVRKVGKDGKQIGTISQPLANGQRLDHIPVSIIGSEDNDPSVDDSALYPIAHVNLGHLRNSATYEDNLDKHGGATTFITGRIDEATIKKVYQGKPMIMGSGEVHIIPGDNINVHLLQLGANQEAATAMLRKEEQIKAMGGDIITDNNSNAPVETTRIVANSKSSKLDSIIDNAQSGLTERLRDIALFENADPDKIVLTLNRELVAVQPNSDMLRSIVDSWYTSRALPQSAVFDYARSCDIVDRELTDDELRAMLAEETPIAGVDFTTTNTFDDKEDDKTV